MKRVLVIKTTSLGDVIHTLPALTDAAKVYPGIQFDWIVEEPFQMIPAWHQNVNRIIPLAFRRWRKQKFKPCFQGELTHLIHSLRSESYDMVIDAQGLLKSALLTLMSKGPKAGFSWTSAREPLASLFYRKKTLASWSEHAVIRSRRLFAGSLGYALPEGTPDYGIEKSRLSQSALGQSAPAQSTLNQKNSSIPYIVLLHGTTWDTKHWPDSYWSQLAELIASAGYQIQLLWGNDLEFKRATEIKNKVGSAVLVLPKLSLREVAGVLAGSSGIVSVDTGLGHLAAALAVPTVSLYGPTDPKRTGILGPNQLHLTVDFPCSPCLSKTCTYKGSQGTQGKDLQGKGSQGTQGSEGNQEIEPPCYMSLPPQKVWQALKSHIALSTT